MKYQPMRLMVLISIGTLLSACQTTRPKVVRDEGLPETVTMGDAKLVLRHLMNGSVPQYEKLPVLEMDIQGDGLDLSDPDFCFARSYGGACEGSSPNDCFEQNTRAFLEPFAKGIRNLPMTKEEYLDDGHTVLMREFGESWLVIINFGTEDYRFGQTLLPPMGFIALGPDFLAQHYYARAVYKHTTLIVIQDGEEYVGFR